MNTLTIDSSDFNSELLASDFLFNLDERNLLNTKSSSQKAKMTLDFLRVKKKVPKNPLLYLFFTNHTTIEHLGH